MKVSPPSPLNQYVARCLRQARLDKQFCQTYMAAQAGLCQSGYSDLENGKRDITLAQLEKLAQALGKPIAYFLPPAPKPAEVEPTK
jgi:transcriptional regulator with XRE-family HTH domain